MNGLYSDRDAAAGSSAAPENPGTVDGSRATNAAVEAKAPLFSIITVCYNAGGLLPATLESLRAQTCTDYEWVVADGASTDGSVDWLKAQRPEGFISAPDRGIYDAMNRAIGLARGEWLYFLNAGDLLMDERVLEDFARLARSPSLDLIYGDVLYVGQGGERPKRFNWLRRGNLLFGDLCHQAAFSRRELYRLHGVFDDRLRYNSDFDWFVRVFKKGARLQYLPRTVARFDDGGLHIQAAESHERERDLVRARYSNRLLWLAGHYALRVELKVRKWLSVDGRMPEMRAGK